MSINATMIGVNVSSPITLMSLFDDQLADFREPPLPPLYI